MSPINRRGMIQVLSAAAAGLLGAAARAEGPPARGGRAQEQSEWRFPPVRNGRMRFSVDVALLGHTDAENTGGRIGDPKGFLDADARGDVFYVEGALYPGGTIPAPTQAVPMPAFPQAPPKRNNQTVWDFKAARPLGHWVDRGWVLFNGTREPYRDRNGTIIDATRPEPRLLSEQSFFFGRFDGAHLSPEMLVTSGVENGVDADSDTVTRAVTGGTGRFARARGEVVQGRLGRNTSTLRSLSAVGVGAPNFRFEFDLALG